MWAASNTFQTLTGNIHSMLASNVGKDCHRAPLMKPKYM